jgi:hypothetical protein
MGIRWEEAILDLWGQRARHACERGGGGFATQAGKEARCYEH